MTVAHVKKIIETRGSLAISLPMFRLAIIM